VPRPESALAYFGRAFRRRPLRVTLGLGVEYATFAAAVFLAILLLVTRYPLAFTDRVLGTRMRDRFVDAIAKLSPG
jgi:hypothetical protein